MSWQTYRNAKYHYEITHPSDYVVVNRSFMAARDAALLDSVSFMTRALANSETANLQLPELQIEVLDNSAGLALSDWLDARKTQGKRESHDIGGLKAYKLSLPTLLAPNEVYYAAHQKVIYRITVVGPNSDAILKSFKVIK